MNIVELLSAERVISPNTPAIIDTYRRRPRRTSLAELEQASVQAAAVLQQANLQPGQAVLVFQPMSAELYIILAAIFRLGLVAMFLDPGQGRDHLEQCCAIHPPQALIASPKAHLLRLVSPALRRIPHKFVMQGGRLRAWTIKRLAESFLNSPFTIHHSPFTIHHSPPHTPALLTFTSGSTGQPKAALRTHGFLLAQHRVLADSLKLTAGQVDLATLPIFVLANLASGVASVIPKADLRYPGKINPGPVVTQIQQEQITSVVASPALLERLVRYCLSSQITLPGLQKIFTGGAPVFPRLLDQLQQIAPHAEVVAVYGSTEAEPMAKIARQQITEADRQAMHGGAGLLAGWPVEAIQLKIIPNGWGAPIGPFTPTEFSNRCRPAGEIGEIVVSGQHVLPGYLHGHGNAETKFKVNHTTWHRTGDAGYLDSQGRLWLLGRCAARIEDERGMLYPFAVECAASFYSQIQRSAMVSRRGQRLLVIELFKNACPPDIASLKKSLAWAGLDELQVIKNIPVDKRHNAKIDYPALHKLLNFK